jgi:hypothetical protein
MSFYPIDPVHDYRGQWSKPAKQCHLTIYETNWQVLLPASCARQGRSGLDQVGALVLGWGQLDSKPQLDWTQAWILSRCVCVLCANICNIPCFQEVLHQAHAVYARLGHIRRAQVQFGLRVSAVYKFGKALTRRAQNLISLSNVAWGLVHSLDIHILFLGKENVINKINENKYYCGDLFLEEMMKFLFFDWSKLSLNFLGYFTVINIWLCDASLAVNLFASVYLVFFSCWPFSNWWACLITIVTIW